MATIISTKTSGVGGLEVTGDATGILQLASNNGTTAVTVDASQNVGIGTASPNANLEISGTGNREIRITSTSGGDPILGMWVPGTTFTFFKVERSTGNLIISDGTERVRMNGANFMFNSGYGSVATAYGCRAWVNFNGTGTVAIRASGNVSSITDNGTGNYTVNLTTAMPDLNYAAPSTCSDPQSQVLSLTTNSFNIITRNSTGTVVDSSIVQCSVFR